MSKFKVGDKVQVRTSFETTEDGLGWNGRMYDTIGKIGMVVDWASFTHNDRCRVEIDGEDWTYLDSVLELVSDEPVEEGVIKVHLDKVGDVCKLTIEGKLNRQEIEDILNVVYGY